MKNQKMFLGVGVYNPSEHKNDNFYIDKNVPRFGSSNDGKPVVGEYNINEVELKLNKKTGISTVKQERKGLFEVSKESKNIPGTGAYNFIKSEQKNFYIEQIMKRFVPAESKNPGVREYDHSPIEIKLRPKAPGVSRAERNLIFDDKENNEKIKLGSYEVKNEISKLDNNKF